MKNRIILIFVLAIFVAVLLAVTSVVALAAIAPLHAGQGLFQVQYWVEHQYERLITNPLSGAQYELLLLERRLGDIKQVTGTPAESEVLNSVYVEIGHALEMFKATQPEDETVLRKLFVQDIDQLLVLLDTATFVAENTPQALEDFRVNITALRAAAENPANSLATLAGTVTIPGIQTGETPAIGSAGVPFSPHMILFPPGSPGAKHLFFPLEGRHAQITCQTCHTEGNYAGTPNQCLDCHMTNRPASHFEGQCALCHNSTAWLPSTFDHATAGAVDCQSCHLSVRPANHFAGQCAACHATTAWLPATFSHQTVGAFDCQSCHLSKRPANHFAGQCSSCHTTTAWTGAVFNHQAAGATDCQSCHISRRPANHFTGQCGACHTTTAWTGAVFNHQVAGATNCQSCHISKRPANHFAGQCSACHSTTSWAGAVFNHQVAGATDCQSCHINRRPANHFAGQCSSCHSTTSWAGAIFNHQAAGATDCQSCHINRRPANHFSGQCSACHSTSSWAGAVFNHQAAGATDCQSCHLSRRPANHFSGQCSDCHSTSGWLPANFNHSFPINHNGANGVCATCHPSGTSSFTCFNCHNQSELTKKHNEKGIPDFIERCMDCHADGRNND